MLMQLYKDEQAQDYSFEDILNHPKLRKSINTKLHSKIKFLLDYGMDMEDIKSEINMSLWKCYQSFEISKGYVFSTYALYIIDVDIKKIINHITRNKRNVLVEQGFRSIYSTIDNNEDSLMLEEVIDNNENCIEDKTVLNQCAKAINKYFKNGTEYEQDLIRCMFGTLTQKSLSDKYGYSKMRHSNKMNDLRNKILKDKNVLALKPIKINHIAKPKPKTTKTSRIINILKNGNKLATFNSFKEIQSKSLDVLGVKLHQSGLSERISNGCNQYKGFTIEIITI